MLEQYFHVRVCRRSVLPGVIREVGMECRLQLGVVKLPRAILPRIDGRATEGFNSTALHGERPAIPEMLRLDFESERRRQPFSVVTPRAHAGTALVGGEAHCAAVVFAEDAHVGPVVREFLERGQI
eukprot:1885447-Prymnesium_polylepis.1